MAFSHHACWSPQGPGVLCVELKVEVIYEDMVSHYYAKATAEGDFVCVQRKLGQKNDHLAAHAKIVTGFKSRKL